MTAPSYIWDEAAAAVRGVAEQIGTPGAEALVDEAEALIRAPAELAEGLARAIAQVRAPERLRGLAAISLPAVPETTASRRRQAKNQRALVAFVQALASVELARRAAAIDYPDRPAAFTMRDRVVELLDQVAVEATDPAYTALRALRAALVDHIRALGSGLPAVVTATTPATLPSLVVAHRLHGDVGRAGDIARRNRLARPGFAVPPFEVATS